MDTYINTNVLFAFVDRDLTFREIARKPTKNYTAYIHHIPLASAGIVFCIYKSAPRAPSLAAVTFRVDHRRARHLDANASSP